MEMHYGKNEYVVWLNSVQDAKWEAVREAAADVSFEYGPSQRIVQYFLDGRVDFYREVIPESLLIFFVVAYGFVELGFSLGMK